MTTTTATFDPVRYKETTREQWQTAAAAWANWGPTLSEWLGPATEVMLDMAGVTAGTRVLDPLCENCYNDAGFPKTGAQRNPL